MPLQNIFYAENTIISLNLISVIYKKYSPYGGQFWICFDPKQYLKLSHGKLFNNDFQTEEQALVYTLPVLVVPLNKKSKCQSKNNFPHHSGSAYIK